jgi:hypothetical protein
MPYVTLPAALLQPGSMIVVPAGEGQHRKGRVVGDDSAVTKLIRAIDMGWGQIKLECRAGDYVVDENTSVKVLV